MSLVLAPYAFTQSPAQNLWDSLAAKRAKLATWHEEFQVTRIAGDYSSQWTAILDVAKGQWREKSVTGGGTTARIFDGNQLFLAEEGSNEFVRPKLQSDSDRDVPIPYAGDRIWSKAADVQRRPCGIPGKGYQCVILEVPIKPSARVGPPFQARRVLRGAQRMIVDEETGLILSLEEVTEIGVEDFREKVDVTYTAKRFSSGVPIDASLFALPASSTREVKQFSPWNAARIRKEFVGSPAPEFALKDMQGHPITLSACKGKTVLLGFWNTYCKLCAGNGAFEELWQKYRDRDLLLVGIFVGEEKSFVEKFLQTHPASYSVALGSQNELPRPYQVGYMPTYIVIGKDGKLESVVEGEQGFTDLRELLKKSGVETQ